ncbi:UDP-2,4-diacetamido-2,4,6-trideoxy-beta-L-altropyranose hydrolase [Azospirillum fermentarium]|uniref:UDP-2,4-diacetamido-2,4, 6-trideoxy-beta-L-altropyranose hydrolase n=1 Tax=Azospirillum fermentarium TaxID=1233114 RepID=UPI002226AC3F|nr:UDP-2,4-diacetamido-2,4,6-trideoxy-beta-L-altropyranose hydrolase [Azospirillum fermentarium]MCW2249521.1 UDP-2,4-diacetamido-2,4,6-trideoxy-beta-L-altropyranose hydrolase [Azospirillum fermentarium]
MPKVCFRCDASPAIGMAHVLRCVALAEVLAEMEWDVVFACSRDTHATVPYIAAMGFDVLPLDVMAQDEPAALGARWAKGCDLLVIDHYGRDAEFERACRLWARHILVFDDLADRPHDADLLLDPTLGRTADHYAGLVPSGCRLLLGPRYALLRSNFVNVCSTAPARRAEHRSVDRILVSLGTNNPFNSTELALDSLKLAGIDAEIDVILGPHTVGQSELLRRAARMQQKVNIHTDSRSVAPVMARADLAIAAASVTSWERCYFGLPTIAVLTSENMRFFARQMAEQDIVMLVEHGREDITQQIARRLRDLAASPSLLARLREAASSVCDGLGLVRLLNVLAPVCARDGKPVLLRPVEAVDAPLVGAWLSDPRLPPLSRVAGGVAAWLDLRLSDPASRLMMIIHGDRPGGLVRLDRREDGGEASHEVSLFIAPDSGGLGLGRAVLHLVRRVLPGVEIRAPMMFNTLASHALFRQAGFVASSGYYRRLSRLPAGRYNH